MYIENGSCQVRLQDTLQTVAKGQLIFLDCYAPHEYGFEEDSDVGNNFSHSQIVENSLAYINEHFSEPLSLDDLARNSNMSAFHFTRVFFSETRNGKIGFRENTVICFFQIKKEAEHITPCL